VEAKEMKRFTLLAVLFIFTAPAWSKAYRYQVPVATGKSQQTISVFPSHAATSNKTAASPPPGTVFTAVQNYPNPFNSATTIEYSLPQEAGVYIAVYNVLGHPVRTLVNTLNAAGHHVVTWDGRDDDGELVASGVYFYRFIADDYHTIRKMLLLK